MKTISIQHFKFRYGELILGSFDNQLCLCDWRYRKMRTEIDQRIQKGLNAVYKNESTPVTLSAIKQLTEYTNGVRKEFDLPLKMVGTNFQQTVWKELLKIPFGETDNYLNISRKIKNEKAIRAVAAANGANAISIIIPCHRIIGSNGSLTGYAGGVHVKEKLLRLESMTPSIEQLRMFDDP